MQFKLSLTAALFSLALATTAVTAQVQGEQDLMARNVADGQDLDTYTFSRRAVDESGEPVLVYRRALPAVAAGLGRVVAGAAGRGGAGKALNVAGIGSSAIPQMNSM